MIIHPDFQIVVGLDGFKVKLPSIVEVKLDTAADRPNGELHVRGEFLGRAVLVTLCRDDAFELWAELSAEICELEGVTLTQLGERFRTAQSAETAG